MAKRPSTKECFRAKTALIRTVLLLIVFFAHRAEFAASDQPSLSYMSSESLDNLCFKDIRQCVRENGFFIKCATAGAARHLIWVVLPSDKAMAMRTFAGGLRGLEESTSVDSSFFCETISDHVQVCTTKRTASLSDLRVLLIDQNGTACCWTLQVDLRYRFVTDSSLFGARCPIHTFLPLILLHTFFR